MDVSLKLDPTRAGGAAGRLHAELLRRVVGQAEAVAQVVKLYQMYTTGMNPPGRPLGNALFLGPTGTGKTRLVEALAECLLGTSKAVLKIDCGEFQHSHEIAKLVGSPPGYLGHRETHALLSQEALSLYHTEEVRVTFVLFDEVEKASDALWNLLLGILDKATLTLGDNRRVDFTRAMIFLTSNLGAAEMAATSRPKLGFGPVYAGEPEEVLRARQGRVGLEAARRKFTPEFINRLDKVVVFNPLGPAELEQILDIELGMVQQRILASPNTLPFCFRVSEEVREYLLSEGTDSKYGARHLKRALERELVQPLSNLIASDQVRGGDLVRVVRDAGSGRLDFVREAQDVPVYEMLSAMDSVRNYAAAAAAC